ncbi:SCP2 sterol-binding domain-containing protein [Micromonospora sp. BRA006-A]|nr:SCP2 sterol-binding domain-containing protein [Micromonospora sp. BRA006-A]
MSEESRRQFFACLVSRADRYVPPRVDGAVRIELATDRGPERWTVIMRGAEVTVTRAETDVDAEMLLSAALFDRLTRGESSALSAALRNEITFAGDLELLRVFSRFFPSPPASSTLARPIGAH